LKIKNYTIKFVIDSLFKKKLIACYNKYQDKPIYLVFDVTTDIRGISILNILIGECRNSEDKVCSIAVLELEKSNAVVINQKIIQTLTDLNKGKINYKNLKLVISDGISYAVKVGKLLKSFF